MAVRRSRKALGRRWEVLQLEVGGRGRCEMRHLRSACSPQFGGLVQGRFATALVPDVRTSELHTVKPHSPFRTATEADFAVRLMCYFFLWFKKSKDTVQDARTAIKRVTRYTYPGPELALSSIFLWRLVLLPMVPLFRHAEVPGPWRLRGCG